jgi:LmbE family N-acetylglucosaminyl deacetylase
MNRFHKLLVLSFVLCAGPSYAQLIEKNASSNIKMSLKKLQNLTRVLYVAAHPDDENTRLISYFANETCAETAYLSLTRGDGGQNLIGTHIGSALGLIRTQELLEARKIDGGKQFFTRAVDFGYSKTAEETFSIWEKEKILYDVVLIIRTFQPDIIVTRFPPNERAGHGHHTASALLAEEAFELAADPERFPEQFVTHGVTVWQTKRLYFNASTWWNKDLEQLAEDSKDYVRINVGTYNPILGLSYGEMAAESRSMHKSQGFGSARQRGNQIEYLQFKLGDQPQSNAAFDGISTGWTRIGKEGIKIQLLLAKAYNDYDAEHPEAIIPTLLEVKKLIKQHQDVRVQQKNRDIDQLVLSLAGVHVATLTDHSVVVPGEEVSLNFNAINRSSLPIVLKKVSIPPHFEKTLQLPLPSNELKTSTTTIKIDSSFTHFSNPYWLNTPFIGIFDVQDAKHIGQAEAPNFSSNYCFELNGIELEMEDVVHHQWVDREKGELHRPLALLPPGTLNFSDPVFIFSDEKKKNVEVHLTAHADNLQGKVLLKAPATWRISPEEIPFNATTRGEELIFQFTLFPPIDATENEVTAAVDFGAKSYEQSLSTIAYDHITTQTLLSPATARLIRLDIVKSGNKLAYVMGAGDAIPECLRQIGYEVDLLESDQLSSLDLSGYKAVIFGIRAFNTQPTLSYAKSHLQQYMENGGTMIVQYNTSRGIDANDFAPYPLHLSRNRVTKENAAVKFLDATHPLLTTPNLLSVNDFDGWVQERGLYFADEWDEEHYTPLLSWHDPEEEPQLGSLLVSEVGNGAFIYTGISFFRQMPAGVPGAYRLFANLISYSSDNAQ